MINTENLMEIQLSLSSPTYRGPKGEKPVKGVDYFTQEDINDIVSQIEIGEISLAGYASKEYVDEAVSGVVVEETDPTVPQWAKQSTKPSYTASEVGALPADIPLFSGSYNDLTNKPSLFSGNYNDLTNKPTIPTVPVNISAFTNDAGYLTSHQSLTGYATESYVDNAIANIELPDGGILVETDPTVPSWAKQASKPTYTAQEVGALPANTALFSGDYNDLSNKPTIPVVPTNVSSFTNDAGYLTTHQSLTDYATKSYVETAIRGAESGLLKRSVVQALPVSDIDEDTIYMVAKTGSTGDVYDEYLYVNSNWEHIGSTDVDLTDYRKAVYLETSENLDAESIAILNEIYNHIVSLNLSNNGNSNVLPSYDIFVNGEHIEYFKKYNTTISLLTGFYGADEFLKHQYVWTKDDTRLWANGVSSISGNDLSVENENSVAGAYPNNSIGKNFKYIKDNYAKLTDIPTVPSNVSAFTNDAGYLTSHQSLSGYATQSYVDTAIANIPSSGSTPIDFEDGYWSEDNGTYSLDMLAIQDYCAQNTDITTEMIFTTETDEATGDSILLSDKLDEIDDALDSIPDVEVLRVPLNTVFSNGNEVAQKLSTFNTALNNHTQKPNYMIVLYNGYNDYQVVHYEGHISLPFPVLWTIQNTQDGFRVFAHYYNANSGYTINEGQVQSNYTLPTATTSTLGGVKVDGTTITISNGVISATPSGSSYTLPTASTSTLGGVKVDGSTITIDANGVISSSASGGSSYTAGNGIDIDSNGVISRTDIGLTGMSLFTSGFVSNFSIGSTPTASTVSQLAENLKKYGISSYSGDNFTPTALNEAMGGTRYITQFLSGDIVPNLSWSVNTYNSTSNVGSWGWRDTPCFVIGQDNKIYGTTSFSKLRMLMGWNLGELIYLNGSQLSNLTTSTDIRRLPNLMSDMNNIIGDINTRIPSAPTTDGDYVLKVSVVSGTPTYSWVSAT